MGKTVTIPTRGIDRDDCVNDEDDLTLEFVEDGDFQTSGDTTDFNPHLDSCQVLKGDNNSYEALRVGAKVQWRFLEGGAVINEGKITIKHNDKTCED
jgi:hypothetical protein